MPARIASLTIDFQTKVGNLTAGLNAGANAIDKFYASVGKKVAAFASPVTGTVKKVGELRSAFGRLASSAAAPLTRVASSVASVGKAATDRLMPLARGLAVSLVGGAVAASGALAGMAGMGIERIDQLGDAAQRVGVTTEALSELRYAANLSGSSAEDLDAALLKLNQNLGDSVAKATPTSQALQRLGLDAKKLAGQSPDAAFEAIVKGFETVPDAARKASIAVDIFGKKGVGLLNTLSSGSGEIARLRDEAKALGVSVSQLEWAKVAAAKDSFDRVGAAIEGVQNNLATQLAPVVQAVADQFVDWFKSTGGGASLVTNAMGGIVKAIAWVMDAGWQVQNVITRVLANIVLAAGKAVSVFSSAGKGMVDMADAMFDGLAERQAKGAPGQDLLKGYDAFTAKIKENAQASAEAFKQQLKLGNSTGAVGQKVGEVTEKLREQVATFGKTAAEIEVYKLAQMGASAAELKEARSLGEQLKALEAGKKDREELENFAKQLKEKSQTPLEKFQEEMGKVKQAMAAGLLDPKDAAKAAQAGSKELLGSGPKFSGAMDIHSSEARTAILNATAGRTPGLSGVEKNTATAASVLKSIDAGIQRLAGASGQPSEMAFT